MSNIDKNGATTQLRQPGIVITDDKIPQSKDEDMSTIPTHQILHGIGVSAGTAAGPAVLVVPAPGVDATEPPSTDAAADGQRVRDAMKAVSEALLAKAEHAPKTSKPILEATAQLARDRGLAKSVDKELKKGTGITKAVHNAVEEYAVMLTQIGGYMAERVTDLYDIRDRTICQLRGLPAPASRICRRRRSWSRTIWLRPRPRRLSKDTVLGIITEAGGPTSHTAILAAQLDIPAVVQAKGAEVIVAGCRVALDGGVGEVIVSPTDAEVELLAERSRRRAAALAGSSGEGATRDGHKVALLANIGTADDARKAAGYDLEGSGLFRTEFLFLERDQAPTLAEQTATYTEVLKAFGDRRASCGPSMPGPTSRWRSPISVPKTTRLWDAAVCG